MYRFSFPNFTKMIIKRQKMKEADTFIIIYGLPRAGKTTLGFNILMPYLKMKRRMYKENKNEWATPRIWSKLLFQYFASSAGDMIKKIRENPDGSFNFVDEGLDVVSWMSQMEREQRNLIKLIQKVGKKRMLSIIIVPNLGLLTKPILSRAQYMFIIIDEPHENMNYAYLFKNYTNPILAENFPFGFKEILKDLLKHPILGEKDLFENYIIGRDRFIGKIKFKPIDKKVYELYDKLVKIPGIEKGGLERRVVSYSRYSKIRYALDTIVYNLYLSDNKSVAQISRLFIDKFGMPLVSQAVIRNHLDIISAMQIKPKISKEEIVESKIEPESFEDIEVDSSLEALEG